MKSELELYKKYFGDDSYGARAKLANKFDSLEKVSTNGDIEVLDVLTIRTTLNEICDYFLLRQRFLKLNDQSKGHLTLVDDGFKLYDATFTSLDEVERALVNKAFL
jgi:hypothetical protein